MLPGMGTAVNQADGISALKSYRLLHISACSGLLCVNLGASGRLESPGQAPSAPTGHLGPQLERQPASTLMKRELSRLTERQNLEPGGPLSPLLHFIAGKTGAKRELRVDGTVNCPQSAASLLQDRPILVAITDLDG